MAVIVKSGGKNVCREHRIKTGKTGRDDGTGKTASSSAGRESSSPTAKECPVIFPTINRWAEAGRILTVNNQKQP
jgi:hypothetical protein